MKLQNTCEGLESLKKNAEVKGLKGYVVKVACEALRKDAELSVQELLNIMWVKNRKNGNEKYHGK